MINIQIQLDNDGNLKIVANEDGKSLSYDTLIGLLLSSVSASTKQLISSFKGPLVEQYKEKLFDDLNDLFDKLLNDLFPQFNEAHLDLTSAAIVYAQDQIIKKAEAEGKTYKEALAEYEEIASKYIAEKKES